MARMRFFRLIYAIGLAAFVASTSPSPADDAPPVIATIKAHPALWTVHSAKGTAYLFDSAHLLPPNIDWHSHAVGAGLKASDVRVATGSKTVSTKLDVPSSKTGARTLEVVANGIPSAPVSITVE